MKKRKNIKVRDVERWIDKGLGQGRGQLYKPWTKVRDVPSTGLSYMVPGLLTDRVHHYHSSGEFHQHHFAERAGATEINEQKALLPAEETQEIAAELGLHHTCYPGTRTPIVMTTDVYVEYGDDAVVAYSVKDMTSYGTDLEQIREVLTSLAIEEAYWHRRGARLEHVIKGKTYNLQVAENLEQIRPHMLTKERDHVNRHVARYLNELKRCWSDTQPRYDLHQNIAMNLQLSQEEVLTIEARLIWLKMLNVDLTQPWDLEAPLALTRVAATREVLRAVA